MIFYSYVPKWYKMKRTGRSIKERFVVRKPFKAIVDRYYHINN